MPLWLAGEPLVLASRSSARRMLLEAAGIPVEVRPADLDERGLEAAAASPTPGAVAAMLAQAKAFAAAKLCPGRLTLGADQTLALNGERFTKPGDRAAARTQLRALRGRTHELHSALAFVTDDGLLFEHVGVARLTMRAFSDRFLELYLDAVGAAATAERGRLSDRGPWAATVRTRRRRLLYGIGVAALGGDGIPAPAWMSRVMSGKRPFILCLTGSLGMGKSTAAKFFAEAGVPVHDADAVVHALYEGQAAPLIEQAFPGATKDGKVDRGKLAAMVLNDTQALARLEAIVHPLVFASREKFLAEAESRGTPVVVLDVPLLFETGAQRRCDAVVVVSAPPDQQRRRAFGRPGMTEDKFAALLAKQVPDAEKRRRADFILDSSQHFDHTRAQIRDILQSIATMPRRQR